jgi:hypothetical protein
VAVTLEELQLKFKSEIAAATSKDEAALARVDAAMRSSQKGLDSMRKAHAANAAAAQAAALEAKIAESAIAGAKPEERASRIAEAKRAQAAAARLAAKEESSAAKAAAAGAQHDALAAGAPELLALAKQKQVIIEKRAAEKRAAVEQVAAGKRAEAEKAAAARGAAMEQAAAGKKLAAAQALSDKLVAADMASARKKLSAGLAAAKQAEKQAAAAEQATAKRQAAEQAAAAKKQVESAKAIQKARDSASEAAHVSRIDASKAAMVGAAGAALAFSVALLAAGAAAVVFGFGAAGAARDARILADALTGTSALGAEFDAVVTQLASKVPMARAQIADLARELNLMKLGRRDMQAGLTAIAITTSAIGDSAGNVIKGVVQSSAAMKRFTLGARNMWGEYQGLAGSGFKSMDVIGRLAVQLGVSTAEAEKRLRLGQVTIKQGTQALEAAAKMRFGSTIAAQMLSVNTQFSKAKENLSKMVSGVNLEPVLDGLRSLLSIFDEGTVAGATLKTLLNVGLGGIGKVLTAILPLGKDFFLEMMIGALQMYLAIRPIARQIRDWIEPFLTAENAATAGKVAIYGIAAAFGLVTIAALAAAAAIMLPFAIAAAVIWVVAAAIRSAWSWLINDAAEAGTNLIDSFVGMLTAGVGRAMDAAKDLASSVAKAFKGALGIASPSKLFQSYGRFTVQGFAEGVEEEAGQAQGAVDDMAPGAPSGGGGGIARLGGGTVVNITMGDVYFAGKKATEEERGGLLDFLNEQLQIATNATGAGQPLGAT